MSRNRGKRNLRDDIAEKMSKKMHISHSVAISMFPYLEIMFQNDEVAWYISDYLDLEDKEIKRFRSKMIPKKVRNKLEKEKAQMRVEERDRRASELLNTVVEEVKPEKVEEQKEEVEVKEEKEEKKKTDKQVSLFSF